VLADVHTTHWCDTHLAYPFEESPPSITLKDVEQVVICSRWCDRHRRVRLPLSAFVDGNTREQRIASVT
jgi:hypothetical protein